MATAAATESISAKLRKDEKDRFSMICDEIGTSPSNAIRMFVSAFNRRGGFPFDPSNPYGFSRETLAAMDDAVTGRNLSGPYNTVKEAMAALDEEWAMLGLRFTTKFKKDYKRVKRQGKDLSRLERTLETLVRGEELPDAMRDHAFGGTYHGHRECHIEPDWLLIYRVDEEGLVLVATRTGSHSELLGL